MYQVDPLALIEVRVSIPTHFSSASSPTRVRESQRSNSSLTKNFLDNSIDTVNATVSLIGILNEYSLT